MVLRKLYPKKKRIEANANFGAIMNQSFIDTMLVYGGLTYHFSEVWGLALEGGMALNQDRMERGCIESFYNDFMDKNERRSQPIEKCVVLDTKRSYEDPLVNIGPAYMPITEIGQLLSLSAIWTPVYGKQIFSFLPRTSHMDIFLTLGGGLAMSTFYPLPAERNGRPLIKNTNREARLRDKNPSESDESKMEMTGANYNDKGEWGTPGRPPEQQKNNAFINFGVGQKYYFLKRMFLKVELRNFTIIGTPSSGYHNFFTFWGGMGVSL